MHLQSMFVKLYRNENNRFPCRSSPQYATLISTRFKKNAANYKAYLNYPFLAPVRLENIFLVKILTPNLIYKIISTMTLTWTNTIPSKVKDFSKNWGDSSPCYNMLANANRLFTNKLPYINSRNHCVRTLPDHEYI